MTNSAPLKCTVCDSEMEREPLIRLLVERKILLDNLKSIAKYEPDNPSRDTNKLQQYAYNAIALTKLEGE